MSASALRGVRRGSGPALRGRIACLCVFLLFVVLAVSPALAAAAPVTTTTTFSDLAPANPGYPAVAFLSGAGVLAGYPDGTFRPGLQLTRAQAAKMLVALWDVSPQGSSPFPDVDRLYAPYVAAAAARGWMKGFPDGSFRPYGLLTRGQMALIMVRSLGWAKEAKSLSRGTVEKSLKRFSDAGSVEPEAQASFALLVERGLFQGDAQSRLAPTAGLTRGQFSLICYRATLRGLAVVEGIRSGGHTDRTRLVLDLSHNPGKVTSDSSRAGVLVVDVAGAAVDGPGPGLSVESGEVRDIATAQLSYRPAVVRARVTLGRGQGSSVFTLPPSDGLGYRVVIDVLRPPAGPPTTSPPPPVPPGSSLGARALQVAKGYLGVPYVWAGSTPLGFDCSGLVQYVYARVGVTLPRTSKEQQSVGTPVARNALKPGDLVFFGSPAHHVGIYAGNGTMINAPYTGTVVRYDSIDRSDYAGARRVG